MTRRALTAVSLVLLLVSSAVSLADQPADAPTSTPIAIPAARQANNVAVVPISGPIGRWTVQSVERRIRDAEAAGAGALVIELDTPGGEVYSVIEISKMIKASSINNTVAWVNDEAHSGGAVIALACREIVTNDPAGFGDVGIIAMDPIGGLVELPAYERRKMLGPLMAEITDSARRNGHDELFVQGFVSLGVELWYVENKTTGQRIFIDRNEYRTLFGEEPTQTRARMASVPTQEGEAPIDTTPAERGEGQDRGAFIPANEDLADLTDLDGAEISPLELLEVESERPVIDESQAGEWALVYDQRVTDGSTFFVLNAQEMVEVGLATAIVHNDEELKAFFGAQNVARIDTSWSERMVVFMTNNVVRGLLIVVFLLGLFLEMTNPGLVIPGAVAAIALIGLLAPPMLVGMASWWEVAAIIAGIFLIILEILVLPGFGVFGISGLVLLFGGLVGTFVQNEPGRMFPGGPGATTDLLWGVTTIVLSTFTAGVGMYMLGKHFSSIPVLNKLVLRSETPEGESLLSAMADPLAPVVPIGTEGRTISSLRPTGRAQFGDQIVDAVSDLEYIDEGTPVRVVGAADFGRVRVTRIDA